MAAYARVTSGNTHGLYDMDDAKKLDDAALEDVLREIEALGEITDRNNSEILMELFNASVPGAKIENYTNAEGTTLDNYYTILLSQVDFNDYL